MKHDYVTYMDRLVYLKELIEKGRITSPEQICSKFECCDKTARNMINRLRERGYEIKYCKNSKKYYLNN
jgi:biotin operon repressor